MQSSSIVESTIPSSLFIIKPEVRDALANNRPVVALESTIITHGMEYPVNRDTALAVEKIVRDLGAIPATIAIIEGVIKVGLTSEDIEMLSTEGKKNSRKCSRRDLAFVLANKMNGSTTVAGTMYLANLAGIRVFVTGGIGGVHRGAEQTFDISADLTELARTPVSVVSAGVKSILDIPKTLEYLETMGVPIVTYQSDDFPDFFTRSSGFKTVFRCDTPEQCAAIIKSQEALKLQTGILFTVPIPADKEADSETMKAGIDQSLREANEKGISGAQITPFLLKRVNELTGGESSASNVELIKNNAALGAQIAIKYCEQTRSVGDKRKELVQGRKITIIGGAAVDIISQSNSIVKGSANSHVGTITMNEGGSTRNVAECLGRLGLGSELTFISAVGDDDKQSFISNSLSRVGISTESLCVKPGDRTAAFTGVLDKNGDFFCGVADMSVLEFIPNQHLDLFKFWESDILVLDSNIGDQTLKYVLSKSQKVKHIIYEPISQEKSERILDVDVFSKITILKPNLIQLCHLIGKINNTNATELQGNFEQDKRMIKLMLIQLAEFSEKSKTASKLDKIVLTMGAEGVLIYETKGSFTHFKAGSIGPNEIKSVVGAGDCFLAGFIYGLVHNQNDESCVANGQLCAELTLKSTKNVSPQIAEKLLFKTTI